MKYKLKTDESAKEPETTHKRKLLIKNKLEILTNYENNFFFLFCFYFRDSNKSTMYQHELNSFTEL